MEGMRKIVSYALLLCGCASSALAEEDAARHKLTLVGIATVKEAEDHMNRRYAGQVVSPSVIQIVPRVSGELLEIGFRDGDHVKEGQMLYRIEPVQYEAAVKSAEAKIAESKAKLEYAQQNYDRINLLYGKNASSRDSMESAWSELNACKATLLSAEADLMTAKDNLKNCTIVAAISGVVGVTNFSVGNYLTPSSGTLLTLISVDPLRVRFPVSVGDLMTIFDTRKDIMENALIRVRLANGKMYPLDGSIELLNNEANSKTDALMVYARFQNPNGELVVGSSVTVYLSKKSGKKFPAILPSAIMHDDKGPYVYVLDPDDIVLRTDVSLGSTTTELQLIESGLNVGDRVIVSGMHKTMPGAKVRVVDVDGTKKPGK